MRFRYKVVNGNGAIYTEWRDDSAISPVKAVQELRQLYPTATLTMERSAGVMSARERAEAENHWLDAIKVFEQANEPLNANPADIWIVD